LGEILNQEPHREYHLVKIELPKILSQDGNFKIGKVRIYSRDLEFDETVECTFELEKLIGEKGYGYFELGVEGAKIAKLIPAEVQDPW
jgi:hypothetical protein